MICRRVPSAAHIRANVARQSKRRTGEPGEVGAASRCEHGHGLARGFEGDQVTTQTKSLFDRLGGEDGINAVTESWVARVGGDDRAKGKFVRDGTAPA